MKIVQILILFWLPLAFPAPAAPAPTSSVASLLHEIDANLIAENMISVSTMVVSSERGDRSIQSKTWKKGADLSFSEVLAPAREKGIKMLKIRDDLWTFYPDADRIVKIAGHMLRQSLMGSDLSYEDMMENRSLEEMYRGELSGEKETLTGRVCLVVQLTAKDDSVAYVKRKVWVDEERRIPLKSELYAKSGKLLKLVEVNEVKQFGKRWYPVNFVYRDMLRAGKGTRIILDSVVFDEKIPATRFNKSNLSK